MSDMKKILSGLFKSAVENVASNIGDKIEDKIEDFVENVKDDIKEKFEIDKKEQTPVEILSSRLTDGCAGELKPMSAEEFSARLSTIGCQAMEFELPGHSVSKPRTLVAYNQENVEYSFVVYPDTQSAVDAYNSKVDNYKKDAKQVILAEEEGSRNFYHSTLKTKQKTVEGYMLFSRIENTTLSIIMLKDNVEKAVQEILKAFGGTGY